MRIQLPIIILVLSTISCAEPFSDIDQDLSEDRSSYFHEKEVGFPSTAPQRNARVYHPPVEDAVPNLYLLQEHNDADTVSVQLQFVKREGVPGPRAMELFIAYPEGLTYSGVDSLPATAQAQKKIIVQDKDQNVLRVIIYSAENVNRLETGGLASLHFEKTDGQGGEFLFASEGHVFAPVDANRGLLFGDALRVGW